MRGCLKNVLAGLGCLTVLTLGGITGWRYRAQLAGLYHSLINRPGAGVEPADSVPSVGRPSAKALESARAKQEAMGRARGPAYVTLSADEMASLLAEGLGITGRAAVDSVEVTLLEDRFGLRAQLKTSVVGSALLGPLAGVLQPREPLVMSGPARVAGVGVIAWEPDSLVIRAFPFPPGAVRLVVNKLTGRPDGAVPIPVPPTVGDLRIRPRGVTFYRRVGQ